MEQKVFFRASSVYEFDQGCSTTEASQNLRKTYGNEVMSEWLMLLLYLFI